jgi:hypothetical protein
MTGTCTDRPGPQPTGPHRPCDRYRHWLRDLPPPAGPAWPQPGAVPGLSTWTASAWRAATILLHRLTGRWGHIPDRERR